MYVKKRNFGFLGIILLCTVVMVFLTSGKAAPAPPEVSGQTYPAQITSGSVVKIRNKSSNKYLRSQEIAYGTGSGQQSVTGFDLLETADNLWTVYAHSSKNKGKVLLQGSTVKSGGLVKLQHLTTGRWLHSHMFRSPLTNQQEVSAFGGAEESDDGDYWKIVLVRSDTWTQDSGFFLQHAETGNYLTINDQARFSRPIQNHVEVSAGRVKQELVATEGIYLPLKESKKKTIKPGETIKIHSEL